MIDLTQLAPVLQRKVRELQFRFTGVVLTSGRRDVQSQAHAMAVNVSQNRQWIQQTYRHAAVLQTAVDMHPEFQEVQDLEDLFIIELDRMPEADRLKVSDHFSGHAVDLQPMEEFYESTGRWVPTESGHLVIDWIHKQPETKYFTTREGGLRRWHWAVKPEPVTV